MKEYERLTKYNEYNHNAEVYAYTVGNENVYFDGIDIVDNENSTTAQETIDKLAELEDKIENGTLIEFPRIVPPIKYNNYSLWSVEYVNRAYGNISTDFYGTKEDAEERLKELQGEWTKKK